MNISLSVLADLLGASVEPDVRSISITGFSSLREASEGDLTFFSDTRYSDLLADTKASVVLIPRGFDQLPRRVIGLAVDDPSASFERLVEAYADSAAAAVSGVHRSAIVADDVVIAPGVFIGANAVVEAGVELGENVHIGPGCYVGYRCKIGSGSRLFANVTINERCVLGKRVIIHSGAVIGADGFGYKFVNGTHQKIRQMGSVQIDDDVEIGACTTIDRARFDRTWIGAGTKIDNQVQIGHNVIIGKHCIIVCGTGIAGSAQVGDYVVIGGQAGIVGHVTVGSFCSIAARAVVTKNLPAGKEEYMGFPAVKASDERRRIAASRMMPHYLERIRALEKAGQVPCN